MRIGQMAVSDKTTSLPGAAGQSINAVHVNSTGLERLEAGVEWVRSEVGRLSKVLESSSNQLVDAVRFHREQHRDVRLPSRKQ